VTVYVAPAHKVLTELHRADPGIPPVTTGPDPTTGATVCGLQMLAVDCWLPVEKRDTDSVCGPCDGRAPAITEEGLF
jgi:hypothetical protein